MQGGELVVARSAPLTSWDGIKALNTQDVQTLGMVNEPLFRMDIDGQPIAGIAELGELSEDRLSYTVKLRDGVTFSDGTPVTAEDVVFSFNHWKDPANALGFWITQVDSAEVSDDGSSVTFRSSVPNAAIEKVLALAAYGVYPAEFGGLAADEFFTAPIGAGPFAVESSTLDQEIVLTRNENYYRPGQPYLDKVTIKIIADPNQQLLQFKSGDVDVIERASLEQVSQLDTGDYAFFDSSLKSILFANNAVAPTDNPDFRRALSLALDRATINAGVFAGEGTAPTSILPVARPGLPGPSNGVWDDFDADEAKQLIADSGYDGRTLQLYVEAARPTEVLLADVVAQALGDVGVDVQVNKVDIATMYDRWLGPAYTGGEFDLAVRELSGFLGTPLGTVSESASYHWYSSADPEVAQTTWDALVGATTDEEGPIVQVLEDWAFDTTVQVPVMDVPAIAALNPRVQGFVYNRPLFYDTDNIYVTDVNG